VLTRWLIVKGFSCSANALILLAFVIVLGVVPIAAQAAVISVCPLGCNYTSIQAAINAASPGDTIQVQSGVYPGILEVNKSLTLTGVDTGQGYPFIDAAGEKTGISITAPSCTLEKLKISNASDSAIVVRADNAYLDSLLIDHLETRHQAPTGPAVYACNVTGFVCSNTVFKAPADTDNMILTDPHNFFIANNIIDNPTGYAVEITSTSRKNPVANGTISGNVITQELGKGIAIVANNNNSYVENLLVQNNTIRGAGGSIGLFIESRNVTILDNEITNNLHSTGEGIYGIMTYGTSDVVVRNNNVHDVSVELAYRFESCDGLNISGNRATANFDTGIGLIAPTNCVMTGNVMEGNAYNFLLYPEVLDDGKLPGNRIDSTNLVNGKPILYYEGINNLLIDNSLQPGTVFLYGCPNATVSGIHEESNDAGITAVNSDQLSITGCSLENMDTGIYLVQSDGMSVQNNKVTGCNEGIMAGEFSSGIVSDNLVEDSGDSGIVAGQFLDNVTFRHNDIRTARAGIYLDSVIVGRNVEFSDNTITESQVAGISANSALGCTIRENRINTTAGVGLDIEESSGLTITGNTVGGKAGSGIYMVESKANNISSNFLNGADEGVTFLREKGTTGSSDNRITDNWINAIVPAGFYVNDMQPGTIGNVSKFARQRETPAKDFPAMALISRSMTSGTGGASFKPDPSPPPNVWNSSSLKGPNIAGGPYLGGNYWASPDETGFSQTHLDRGDGFCNEPNTLGAKNIDYLPLHLIGGEIPITAPAIINTPGNYRLMNDLSNATADTAILITASDVVLNGNAHTLQGVLNPNSSGILAENNSGALKNITVTNLTVSGWGAGLQILGVTNSTFAGDDADNNKAGFMIGNSSGIIVRNCTVNDNIPLGSEGVFFGGIGIDINDSHFIRILDSTISHNGWGEHLPTVGGYGILITNGSSLFISGCDINQNVNTGIWNFQSKNVTVSGNRLHGNTGNGGIFMTPFSADPILDGSIADNTISGSGWGIWLTGNNYAVRNNTITGCGYGILLDTCQNATLAENTMSDNEINFDVEGVNKEEYYHQVGTSNTVDGHPIYYLVKQPGMVIDGTTRAGTIYGISCGNLTVRDVTLEKNGYGLFLLGCDRPVIRNVTAADNSVGFSITNSDNAVLDRCTARANVPDGFRIKDSDGIQITGSGTFMNHDSIGDGAGISVENCRDILIRNVNASQNGFAGIDLEGSGNASLTGLAVEMNQAAGMIIGGESIRISGCTIRNNNGPGIGMLKSTDISIWNNFFSNDVNIDFSHGKVTGSALNISKTTGPNIVNGPFIGGNYWASPDGTGFSQTHPDRGDGFCNESYAIDADHVDYLPLHVYSPKPTFYADFTVSPASGTAPLNVKCADKSIGSPTSYNYNFGDGFNATGPNPAHTYRSPGIYTITLSIMKFNVTTHSFMSNSTSKMNIVTVDSVPFVIPAANFVASPTQGTAPLTVTFTDQSSGNPTFYNYDFGDGINVSARNPVHTYRYPGVYNVTLTVMKNDVANATVIMNTSVRTSLIAVTSQ
jgi:parallel beta-helix repeat protein